jgi:PAS domain S-box-containing protein
MVSTQSKLRLIVGAGVLALLLVGSVTLAATRRAFAGGMDDPALRLAQALVVILMILAVVLSWIAYASLHDDIQRRAAVEAALRASEAKFSGILEIAADAIISVDERQRILHYNSGAERIFGWTAQEATGRELGFLLPERFRGHHGRFVQGFGSAPDRARQMGERRAISGLRRDGTEFPAEASISKLELATGERLYTVLLRDVTERQQREEAQQRLRQAVSVLGETLEVSATERTVVQLPVGWLADAAVLDLATSSGPLRRVVATAEDPALGALLSPMADQRIDLDSPARVVDVFRRGEAEHVPVVDDEWLEAHTDSPEEFQRARAMRVRAVLLLPLTARDHVLGVLTLFRVGDNQAFAETDITIAKELALRAAFALDNAQLYATARQATIARDHALGVVSHDLRNPISAIGMCARALLAATPESDVERRHLATTIADSTELTQRMIRDLLDVASIELGRLRIERRALAMPPVLAQAAELFRRDAEARGVALQVDALPKLPEILGDEQRIVQVLANLIGNAMRFTDRGGAVRLAARRVPGFIEVSVHDTGAGIPPSELPRIFERYWSIRQNAPKGGTGLGLAIARGIVEAHGGTLWAESVVGKGSSFRFTLPVA